MFKRFLIVILSAACVMALASCGTDASAETAAETAPEKAAAREDVTRAGWSLGDIAALSEVVTGITDREYATGEGAAYKIHEDITYDRDIVYTVLFNTASVRFDTPGVYDMTYWVYFDAAALKEWADENGVSLDIPDEGRLAVWVSATVTVTEAEDTDAEDAEDDAAEAAEEAASGALGDESASAGAGSGSESVSSGSSKSGGSGSSKSASSGSSKSSGSTSVCDHDWVEIMREEDVYETKTIWICNQCGTDISDDPEGHNYQHLLNHESGGYHSSVKSVKVGTKTVGTGTYKCSKCGATK